MQVCDLVTLSALSMGSTMDDGPGWSNCLWVTDLMVDIGDDNPLQEICFCADHNLQATFQYTVNICNIYLFLIQ